MNKTELVKRIARESKITHSPLTQAQVRQVLDALFAALTEELSHPGGRVEIEHFGVLESKTIMTPTDGILKPKSAQKHLSTIGHTIVKFRMSKYLRGLAKHRILGT